MAEACNSSTLGDRWKDCKFLTVATYTLSQNKKYFKREKTVGNERLCLKAWCPLPALWFQGAAAVCSLLCGFLSALRWGLVVFLGPENSWAGAFLLPQLAAENILRLGPCCFLEVHPWIGYIWELRKAGRFLASWWSVS